jgi:cytochrome c-type biogenesis protein CcsB
MNSSFFSLNKQSQANNEKNSILVIENNLSTRTDNIQPVSNSIMLNSLASADIYQNNNNASLDKKNLIIKKFDVGRTGIFSANLSLLLLLILRWIESGHFPLSNLYESLMFLSWSLTLFHLILERMTTITFTWLGAITSPTALFTTAFANFSLPSEMQHSSALVPALQSNWLMMHVTVMILSYAALIFGCLLSIGFLILTYSISSEQYEIEFKNDKSMLSTTNRQFSKVRWAHNLDNLSYRMLGIGFPLLTIGILSGAVWANEAWGSYWSWDPKETWALLTWFVFAIYLHTRITKNWQGKKPAIIASFGFFVVWICYLGVNLLGEGLHSYGWLQF